MNVLGGERCIILLVLEGGIKHEASHGKEQTKRGQEREDDGDRAVSALDHVIRRAIIWSNTVCGTV